MSHEQTAQFALVQHGREAEEANGRALQIEGHRRNSKNPTWKPPFRKYEWIGWPRIITIGEFTFAAQFIYVGPSSDAHVKNRAVVDLSLSLEKPSNREAVKFAPNPSFLLLSPQARYIYVEWLAGGRSDPQVPIECVFLFFFGLEQRLLSDQSEADASSILAEVERLQRIYGYEPTFAHHSRSLLKAGQIAFHRHSFPIVASLDMRLKGEFPANVQLALGRIIEARMPICAEEALCWAISHPQIPIGQPVRRCWPEFRRLWHTFYDEAFPSGMQVRRPRSRLHFHYRAASGDFCTVLDIGDLPNIAAISGPLAILSALAERCTAELRPLSRLVSRCPDSAGTLLASLTSPVEAQIDSHHRAELKAELFDFVGGDVVGEVRLGALLDVIMTGSVCPNFRRKLRQSLGSVLASIDLGFEPDDHSGSVIKLNEKATICLFALDVKATSRLAPLPIWFRSAIQLSVLALADSSGVKRDQSEMLALLNETANLHEMQRRRSTALLRAVTQNPPNFAGARRRLLALSKTEKETALSAIMKVIVLSAAISPGVIRFLERLFESVGMPKHEVYTRLHELAGGEDLVEQTHQPSKAHGAKIAELRAQTDAISHKLRDIFRDPDAASPRISAIGLAASPIPGLDSAHARLVIALSRRSHSQLDFHALCIAENLLVQGAAEVINDWAFERLGECIIGEDGSIRIPYSLLEEGMQA